MVETWNLLIWAMTAQGTWKWFELPYATHVECRRVFELALTRVHEAGEGGRGVEVRACRRLENGGQ